MNNCLHWDVTAADADGGKTAPAAWARVVRHMIVVVLVTAAALDLTRCGLVMAAARYPAPTAGLVTIGLAAAALTARTARGCRAGHRWAGWAALLIGVASAPQAAASGFRSPYMIPDSATAALGILLAITILATAGRMDRRDATPKILPLRPAEPRGDPERARKRARGASAGPQPRGCKPPKNSGRLAFAARGLPRSRPVSPPGSPRPGRPVARRTWRAACPALLPRCPRRSRPPGVQGPGPGGGSAAARLKVRCPDQGAR